MDNQQITDALAILKTKAATDDPAVNQAIELLGDYAAAGNISNSTGVAIGRNIRMVINQVNLPPETVTKLLDLRNLVGRFLNLDPDRYRLDTFIKRKGEHFIGREHVFEAIERFIQHQPNGYFIIEADPGMGKSALLAEYVRRTGCITHFNVRGLGVNTARQFLESVCAQLIVDYGLPYASLPADVAADGAFLAQLLREASAKLTPGERILIAVDALDEVELTGHSPGANLLYLPTVLPDRVYFVMTQRQVTLPLVVQVPQKRLDLMRFPAENREDVERYLRRAAERSQLKAWIKGRELPVEEFVDKLAELSANNFMYLLHVVPEIENGAYQDLGIERLPAGLEGYYDDHWRHMGMTTRPLPRVKIRIIYILCEVRQPVSRQLITQFADSAGLRVDELMTQEVLDEWDQFLHEQSRSEGTLYSIYHASFRDFLHRKDVVQAAGVSIQDINALIAEDLWASLFGDE